MIEIEKARIDCAELSPDGTYGKFVVEPLERGFGNTLGNALRRVLLSSLPGVAVTSIKIEGIQHEFSTVPGVTEDVSELILNLKTLSAKLYSDQPKTVMLDVKGPAEVKAKDIAIDDELEFIDPEMHIATLNEDAHLQMTLTIDKGRGYVSTILVQSGTLHVGDVILSGTYTGRVKAMFNENGKKVESAGPSTPVQVLGLNGAPQAGDTFNVMEDDRSAREIANKREQLQRMQGIMTQKHVTLDEIGRRIAIGSFKELNIIVKGDVDGSIEAMSGSLIKLSKETVQVNVIHAAVGQISESDVLLAAASNAIIVGFQVRPSASARKLAEKEEIEIRLYSIIYDAINDIKDAIEGMLEPVMKEEIVASVEVLEIFKISKVGTVAGCVVREGRLQRNTPIRVIRDGIVIYTGKLGSLKRFKDDVKEVTNGQDCGLNIESFNDIRVGDIVEGYEQVEVKRK